MSVFNPKPYLPEVTKKIRDALGMADGSRQPRVMIVLGTGWNEEVVLEDERTISLTELPGFESLGTLKGHKRELCLGFLNGTCVLVLRGRVHQFEGLHGPLADQMVRLQVELGIPLGVKDYVLTNAAGGFAGKSSVGDIVVIDGFISLFAQPAPLLPGEWESADSALDPDLMGLAFKCGPAGPAGMLSGGYLIKSGANFEGLKYDKAVMRNTGATCVGMSTFPEASVLAQYRESGVRVLALSYITNDDTGVHSHEANQTQAKKDAPKLRALLENIVKSLK